MHPGHADDLVAAPNLRLTVRWAVWIGLLGVAALLPACANLGALECQGDTCADAANAEGSAGAGDGGVRGIACGAGGTCNAQTQECCLEPGGGTRCVATQTCSRGSDIFCDDPSQCPGAGTCWICVNDAGFEGTSCNYQSDIVANDHCDMSNALALCHASSQCTGGKTCQPFAVDNLDAGTGTTWFSACQ